MRTLLLPLFCCLCWSFTGFSQIYTAIPDPNFENALFTQGIDNTANDGQVLTANISGLVELDVRSSNITDMTGIEDFAALSSLLASFNNLSTIDVSNNSNLRSLQVDFNALTSINLTNNTALEVIVLNNNNLSSIDVSANINLTQLRIGGNNISSLDVTNNTELTRLDTAGFNTISTIDLSNNTKLTRLNFRLNSLTSLDISNSPLLTRLNVQNNQLQSLNVKNGNNTNFTEFEARGNSNLSCILVDDANYATANFIFVDSGTVFNDVSCIPYTSIPDPNFEAALNTLGYDDIPGDGRVPTNLISTISNLNLENQNISNLTGIQDFAALSDLNVSNNSLGFLDLSSNTNLISLTANNNMLSAVNFGTNPLLTDVFVSNNNLSDLNVTNTTNLRNLNCSNNIFFSNLFGLGASLVTLNVSNTSISALDLRTNTALEVLEADGISQLSSLDIRNGTNTSITVFRTTSCPNLTCISVDDVAYSNANWTNIDPTAYFSATDCQYTSIPDANFEARLGVLGYDDIANDGQVPTSLIASVVSLDISNRNINTVTGIEDFTALEILRANLNNLTTIDVTNNTALKELYLTSNNLTAIILANNPLLERLEIGSNGLTTLDLSANTNLLRMGAESNTLSTLNVTGLTQLTELDIDNNALTAVDISTNMMLTGVDIENNNFSSLNLSGYTQLVVVKAANNSNLTTLNLSGTTSLSAVLTSNCNISAIDVSNSPLLENFDMSNNALTSLDLSNNPILKSVRVQQNNLSSLNLNNGNNSGIVFGIDARNNPNLFCIRVSDLAYANANWFNIDAQTQFSTTDYCRYTTIPDANFETELANLGYDDISGDGQVPTALIEVVTLLDVRFDNISDLTGIEAFTALEQLRANNNNISTIDLSSNTALKELTLSTNNLTSLNLTNNLLLERLNIRRNNLTTLDVSLNTQLLSIDVEENLLNTINLSGLTALTSLNVNDNALTNLDVSSNTLLSSLSFGNNNIGSIDVAGFTNLQIIDGSGNANLSTLKLTGTTSLEILQVNNGNVSDVDLSGSTALFFMSMANHALTSLDLSNNPNLSILQVNQNNLSTLDLRNGNNTIISGFSTSNNPNLTCISVDDPAFAIANFTQRDPQTLFSANCGTYTFIPDSNFENRLGGLDDIPNDNQVPTANIETVTNLSVSFSGITDLTGIEAFTALETLDISDNIINTVNLSNNTALRIVRANRCSIQTLTLPTGTTLELLALGRNQLTFIDLSNNSGLKEVYVGENQLTTINVSALPNLTNLWVNKNTLTSLNLSNNPLIQDLNIDENNISSLNLSGLTLLTRFEATNAGLTSLDVRNGNTENFTRFDVNNNPGLTCINISNPTFALQNFNIVDPQTSFSTNCGTYTTIVDANFEAALNTLGLDDIAGDNQVPTANINTLTSLDISGNMIADLTGIQDFIALQTLNVAQNNLDSLELIYTLTSLQSITANNNVLYVEDFSTLTSLTALDISSNNLISLSIKNGNNTNFTNFKATGNSMLPCILVDDATYAMTNFTNIDAGTTFSATQCTFAYTAIPDANFENQLSAYDDIPNDGQVPSVNIYNVTSLSMNSDGISDLTGIQDFIRLETLSVRNNSLTSLDLSNNLLLRELNARNNSNLATVNLSNNIALRELDLSDCNLSAIDLSTNILLKEVDLGDNQLTSVDLSALTALEEIDLDYNQLTSMDFSNNLALQELDVSENPTFTTITLGAFPNLRFLEVDYTSLSSIDVSNLPALVLLRVNNTRITSLNASQNPVLKELSISSNPNLNYLNVKNGNNTNFTVFTSWNTPNLSCIEVDDAAYSTANWTNIDAANNFTSGTCYTAIPDANFEAALNTLGYDDIAADGQVPTGLISVVTTLDVNNQNITDLTGIEDFKALEFLFTYNNPITTLNISQNINLLNILSSDTNLTSIDISNNPNLRFLNINGNSITSLNTSNNPNLVSIRANDNMLSALNVSVNPNLTRITCENNSISSIDVSTQSSLLFFEASGNNFTAIDLSNNPLLRRVIVNNNNLTFLNVKNGNNTGITDFNATNNPNLTCILVDDVAYSTTNWTNIDMQTSFNNTSCGNNFNLAIKVYLQGAALNPNIEQENLMRDDLRVAGFIPTTSPYADGLTCNAAVFTTTGSDAIVDWIWVELRNQTNNTTASYARSALVQRDGDIVAIDGTSLLNFITTEDTYYVSVHHRSHLGIMSSIPINFSMSTTIDFTNSAVTPTFGSNAQTTSGMPSGVSGMWSGDVNNDTIVQYSGTNPDTPDLLSTVLNDPGNFLNFPTFSITRYDVNDVNMDGVIQYSGTNPDTPFILQNVLAHPGNFLNFSTYQILEQLPENFQT
ncbi:MAG: hypothetical protein AAF611_06595 [Bacteroidota bacterium]